MFTSIRLLDRTSRYHTHALSRLTGLTALFSGLFAALLTSSALAAVTVDQGSLYLELNASTAQFRWGDRPGGALDQIQPLRVKQKCVVEAQQAGDADLVSIGPIGDPGLIFSSLGIASSKGVGCGRLESRIGGTDVDQALNISFGSALTGLKAIEIGLDLELKGDVRGTITTSLGNVQTGTWTLLSGSNAAGQPGCDAVSGEVCEVGDVNILCPSTSDSGADSGGADNCRVTLNVEADAIFLQALDGEFGVEGGGDSGTQPTEFKLVSTFEGELDCLEKVTIGELEEDYNLVARRLLNLGNSACELIPYNLDFDGTTINFEKLDLGQLVAHDLKAEFDEESIPLPACYPNCVNLAFIPSTLQEFDGGIGEVPIPVCTGTPMYFDGNDFDSEGAPLDGELKDFVPPAGGWTDLDTSLSGLQHGCWYDQDVVILGPDPADPTRLIIKVNQKIYLIGDWAARRNIQ
jgi:hypothetical protein